MSEQPYTQLEIEHCIHAENRWGESFVEAIHDLERASLSDVLEEFWTIYGRHPDGRAEALHDTGDHTQAYIIAMLLSRVAFNHIPVIDNSPEERNNEPPTTRCHSRRTAPASAAHR